MVTVQCQTCGKSLEKFACHVQRVQYHFCSKECRSAPSIPLVCQECGCTFMANAYTYREAKFCSHECTLARNRREQIHKNGLRKPPPLITKNCERCGQEYQVRGSTAKVQRYCSQACSGATIGEHHQGENSPTWKGKITIVCDYCGKQFQTFPSRAERRKYCCKEHRILGNLQRLAQNHRTNIEIAMRNALEQAGIAFEEQAIMYSKFLVDFRLTDWSIIVQCDGVYWHDRPKIKARDKGQDRYLAKAGYVVLRFNDKQILENVAYCIKTIRQVIRTGQMPLINY